MPASVIMPKFEMAQETGTVARWLVQDGDVVKKGDPLLEVETDKVTMEVESPAAGTVAGISAAPGEVIPIGQTIAFILKPGETLPTDETPAGAGTDEVGEPPTGAASGTVRERDEAEVRVSPLAERIAGAHGLDVRTVTGTGPHGHVTREDVEAALAAATPAQPGAIRAVPAARRLARELNADLAEITGTGPEGRIQSHDVRRAAEAAVSASAMPPTVEAPFVTPRTAEPGRPAVRRIVPLTNMRRVIAERMTASVREAPQFTVTMDADMSRALAMVDDLKAAEGGPKVTLTTLLIKACVWALAQYPAANASFEGDHIAEWDEVNVGVATAAEQGLLVPVIRNANRLGLREISARLSELTLRAREGRLKLDDIQGATFTLSNLGMFGVDRFTAIVNPPQAAILAVGRVAKRAVVTADDQVVVMPQATLTLTADHRVLDGAGAAQFLSVMQKVLEHPGLLLG